MPIPTIECLIPVIYLFAECKISARLEEGHVEHRVKPYLEGQRGEEHAPWCYFYLQFKSNILKIRHFKIDKFVVQRMFEKLLFKDQ